MKVEELFSECALDIKGGEEAGKKQHWIEGEDEL